MSLGIFSDLIDSAVSTAKTIVGVVHDVFTTISKVVKKKYNEVKEKYADVDVDEMKKNRFDELKIVNDEIIDFERKYKRDGHLSDIDKEKLDYLYRRRKDLRTKVENAKEYEAAQDIDENEEKYEKRNVDYENPNELIRLGGQIMLEKKCKRCRRPMSIRWRTGIVSPTIRDLFWGCSGFFIRDKSQNPLCQNTEPLTKHDCEIFANFNREGFDLSTEKLNRIILTSDQNIIRRLQYSIDDLTDNYLCPIHHERMKLKTKNNADNLLDLYYLSCSRCDQKVKIKTAAQIDAVLESFTSKGLFE